MAFMLVSIHFKAYRGVFLQKKNNIVNSYTFSEKWSVNFAGILEFAFANTK